MTTWHKVTSVLLFVIVALGLGACGGKSVPVSVEQPSVSDHYATFEKSLPSGAKVECVGWRYAGPDGKGAALECFPLTK